MDLEPGKKNCPKGYTRNKTITKNYPYQCIKPGTRRCPPRHRIKNGECVRIARTLRAKSPKAKSPKAKSPKSPKSPKTPKAKSPKTPKAKSPKTPKAKSPNGFESWYASPDPYDEWRENMGEITPTSPIKPKYEKRTFWNMFMPLKKKKPPLKKRSPKSLTQKRFSRDNDFYGI